MSSASLWKSMVPSRAAGTHPCWKQNACTHHPARLSPHGCWCVESSKTALEVWGKGKRDQCWGTAPAVPSELFCSVFWCGGQIGLELFMYQAVWSCLISRQCKNCSNYRCCGLQGLEIPCVRNVGLGLESWNFIWEHLSIYQKCVVRTNQQIWVSLGLDALARVWYSWKAQWANRSQALLGQGRSVALNTEMNQASCSWLAFFRVWTVLYLV